MKKYVIIIMLLLALALQGCSSKVEDNKEKVKTVTSDKAEGQETEDTSEKVEPTIALVETNEVTAVPELELVLPITVNDTGKVLIQTVSKSSTYPYTSYIITSSKGESVVVDPTQMPTKKIVDINPAAILGTHSHPDHTDAIFTKEYDVPKLLYKKGEIDTDDFHIYSIISSHSNDTIAETNNNVIVVFEVDGLRIAHMGDIGQTSLTEEQLAELGEIDIAFMQFENSYSGMSLENAKGFTIIEQLNPKIIIPTRYTEKALPKLEEKYGTITDFENILEITAEELPDFSLNVYRILNHHKYN